MSTKQSLNPGITEPVARHALWALIAASITACGESGEVVRAPMPGSLVVTTQTSGFMKDDQYELLVDGESRGTLGANDQLAVEGLDPATYQVALADVADNCVVEEASVPVASEDTADVALSIVCTHPAPVSYTLRFNRDRPDLETGTLTTCSFGICPTNEAWDIYAYYSTQSAPNSVIRQNQTTAVEIAHLPGVALDELTEADVEGAQFTTELVADPFDAGRVLLIRTDLGSVYALGNPIVDGTAQTLTFEAARIVEP